MKDDLRRHFLAIRMQMSPQDVTKKSSVIADQIIATIDWKNIKTLHCFLPLVDDHEPDMRPVIEYALTKNVAVYTSDPAVETGRKVKTLEATEDQNKIMQYDLAANIQFDVVIVPMIAYDSDTKHRLGFGSGFYDRFLATQTKAKTIGVCFTECMTSIQAETHDQPLDIIISN